MAFEADVVSLLTEIRDALMGPEAYSDTDNAPRGLIRSVTVVTPGTPVRGPDVPLPPGYTVTVRQRHHSGNPVGYFGFSQDDVLVDGHRSVWHDNDSLTLSTKRVGNMKYLWFDADTASTVFEIIVEF